MDGDTISFCIFCQERIYFFMTFAQTRFATCAAQKFSLQLIMQNYAQWLSAKIEEIQKEFSRTGKKPSLLLHACCAPCSSYVLEYLRRFFEITIFYYNPNIHPQAEYARRLNELKNFLPKFSADADNENFNLVEAEYFPKEFFDAVQAERDNLQNERERGERCRRCYKLRMERAFDFAQKNKFYFFTTTLSISPHKDAQKINEIGAELEKNNLEKIAQSKTRAENILENQNENFSCEKNSSSFKINSQNVAENFSDAQAKSASAKIDVSCEFDFKGTKYLYADFKKQNGFKRSLELSKKYGLYRQDYCGCIYSKENLR